MSAVATSTVLTKPVPDPQVLGTSLPMRSFPALSPRPPENHLLAALPASVLSSITSAFELVNLRAGQVLSGPGAASYVYFPLEGLISLVCMNEDGGTTEIALVGNEGMVGVSLFMGGSSTTSQAIARCPGRAYRMRVSALREHFNVCAQLRDLLLRYMQALLTQCSQTAVCNRHHSVEQQLCRWLLSAIDRLPSNQIEMTQESIANALGVRRAGINEVATRLQAEGSLRYSRGQITVTDRTRLEHRACECYRIVKQELVRP